MYVLTRDTSYYNHVAYFENLEDAEKAAKSMIEDYAYIGYSEEFKITIAAVVKTFDFTPEEE